VTRAVRRSTRLMASSFIVSRHEPIIAWGVEERHATTQTRPLVSMPRGAARVIPENSIFVLGLGQPRGTKSNVDSTLHKSVDPCTGASRCWSYLSRVCHKPRPSRPKSKHCVCSITIVSSPG
jgi:hypothetical protein